MENVILNSFLGSLLENSLVDSAVYDPASGQGALIFSGKSTISFSLKEKGFVVSGKDPVEIYCPNPEASLVRVLSAKLFGTTNAKFGNKVYNSVTIYPKSVRSDGVVFSTADGKEFIQSSSNTRVTLGLYDILYSRNADSSVLMLPELLPSGNDVVSIASQKLRDCFVSVKNECLMPGATTITPEVCIASGDISSYTKINKLYSDLSLIGSAAPTAEQIVDNCDSVVIQSAKTGYTMSSQLSLDTGISYHLDEVIQPSFALVQSTLNSANHLVNELELGVILSGAHRQAIKSLREKPEVVNQKSSLSYHMAESQGASVSKYWGVPVAASKVKTFVWSY